MIRESREQVEDGNPVKFFIRDDGFEGTYSIAARTKNSSITSAISTSIDDGEALRPFMTLTPQTMQSLFNQMWHLGFRPKDGSGNSGHLEALNRHLEDMRSLVFKVGVN